MNAFDQALSILRDPNVSSGFTVMAHGKPGWIVDVKHQIVAVGPAETTALAQIGVGLPARVELVKATLEKQAQAMTPAIQIPVTLRGAPTTKPWFWLAVGGGGILAGVLVTILVMRSRST